VLFYLLFSSPNFSLFLSVPNTITCTRDPYDPFPWSRPCTQAAPSRTFLQISIAPSFHANGFHSPHRRRDLQGLHRPKNRHRSRSLSRSFLSLSHFSFSPSNFSHRPNTLGLFLLSDVDEFYGLCDPGTANPRI